MAQQSYQDVLPFSQSYPLYDNWPFYPSDGPSLGSSFLASTQVQSSDAEHVVYQPNPPQRISALTDENTLPSRQWPPAMQQWSHWSLDQGAGYTYAMHKNTGCTYQDSPLESTALYSDLEATYMPDTGQSGLLHRKFPPYIAATPFASGRADFNPESFDSNSNPSTVESDASPDQSLQSSFRNNSVSSSSPRRPTHRSSPYAITQRGRSFSDGAAVVLSREQHDANLLNNATSTQDLFPRRPDAYAGAQRLSANGHVCSASATRSKVDVQACPRPPLTAFALRNLTSASSSGSLTPVKYDLAPSKSHDTESPARAMNPYLSSLPTPPNLFSDLMCPPLSPPILPTSIEPHHQNSRFTGDLYTPRYTRNHGPFREGWCGFCRPGRWLVLKNSAFWYDKCFGHGICATTGMRFEEPEEMRPTRGKGGDVAGWQGRCGTCREWIVLAGGKRKGVPWFRHAYKVKAA